MKIIGITGPSGAGKSVFTEYCSSLGIATIDADRVYHEMLIPPSECLAAIRDAFGDKVFNGDGSLNRTVLSEIVFTDKRKLKLLNDTVLGMVVVNIEGVIKELEAKGHTAVIVDAPTLIESGFNKKCDAVISVICPKNERVKRISQRDGIDEKRARERVDAQKSNDFYIAASDYTLINDADENEFKQKAEKMARKLGLTK